MPRKEAGCGRPDVTTAMQVGGQTELLSFPFSSRRNHPLCCLLSTHLSSAKKASERKRTHTLLLPSCPLTEREGVGVGNSVTRLGS